jgi:signal transduction histidine kinase
MKPIKLLTLTSWNYVAIFTILTMIFFVIFFVIIEREVFHSVDEILYNRKVRILEEIKNSRKIPEPAFRYTDFILSPATVQAPLADHYADTIIYETADNEWDEFRKLSARAEIDGKFYNIEIVIARLETHEIVSSITKSLALAFGLMVLVFFFTSRFFSKKLWRPFYSTLHKLNEFEIDRAGKLDLKPGRIEEFVNLNDSIQNLIGRTRRIFDSQKQFIENASHEMQTPLAITQSKLEQLIDDPNLTEQQSEIIQAVINSTQRMSRLNKTLLLLSKIENEQFLEKEPVKILPLVSDILSDFEDQREAKQITVHTDIGEGATVTGNKTLIDVLITNLVKNAFVHNKDGGTILIHISEKCLMISNTSDGVVIPPEQLFQRFYKNTTRKDSWGLGLAIVNKICALNAWKITYFKKDEVHSFTVVFQ